MALFLALAMIMSMPISAFAVDFDQTDEEQDYYEEWSVESEEDGSIYIQNDATGETIVYAFRIDENGDEQPIDLADYACELNAASRLNQTIESSNEVADDSVQRKPSAVTYAYEESLSYRVVGNGIKVTPEVPGPASLSYGESVTVSEQFGGGISISAQVEEAITAGASFTWNKQLSTSSTFTVTKEIPAGRTGYMEFRPYFNATTGTLTRMIVHIPGGVVSSTDYNAWGRSPIILATGFADGIYDVVYTN